MIGKKMLMWIGAGVLSIATIPAVAVTHRHIVSKTHAKVAHGSAKATTKSHAKVVAGHVVHAAPVRHLHRVHATNKSHAVHATHAVHAVHAVHTSHTSHKAVGVTSMHSGKTNIASAKASATVKAAHVVSTRHVTAKAAPTAITLSAVSTKPKVVTHTNISKTANMH